MSAEELEKLDTVEAETMRETEEGFAPEAEEKPGETQEGGFRRNLRRKVGAGAVALVTSASMLVGGIFNSPALLPDDENPMPQIAYTESDEDDLDGSGDDGDGKDGAAAPEAAEEEAPETAPPVEEPQQAPDVWDDERRKLQRLPLGVRLLAVPLAALLCWLLIGGLSALLGPVLGPIVGGILSWALLLAALLGGFAAAVKTVFPDLPLKKILNKRSIAGVLIGGAVLAAADIVLPLFWAEYTRVEALVRALGILAVMGTAAGSFTVRENRRRKTEAEAEECEEEEEPEAEEDRPMTREEILALADTVSRKRK